MTCPAPIPPLHQSRLERAIGVIYLPQHGTTEPLFPCVILTQQFDFLLHFDTTRAVGPNGANECFWEQGELPETYPTAL